MIPSCTNHIEEIDRERIITIDFPDATFALEKFELEGGILFAFYSFEDTTGPAKTPYKNSYNLSVFNITGQINDVKFKRIKRNNKPLS